MTYISPARIEPDEWAEVVADADTFAIEAMYGAPLRSEFEVTPDGRLVLARR